MFLAPAMFFQEVSANFGPSVLCCICKENRHEEMLTSSQHMPKKSYFGHSKSEGEVPAHINIHRLINILLTVVCFLLRINCVRIWLVLDYQ